MRPAFLSILLSLCASIILAQNDDDNVLITNKQNNFIFENSKNGIIVKETAVTNFEASKMSETVSFFEFYNNEVEINSIKIKGIKNVKPAYKLYVSDDLFYSDAKVCHFKLPFESKGKTAQVELQKTIKDPRYFTSVYLSEPHFLKQKTVNITVPEWMNVEVLEKNFGNNITKSIIEDPKTKAKTYSYRIENEKADVFEEEMQGRTYVFPHLMILIKSASPEGNKITYFEKLQDQYNWYKALVNEVDNDTSIIRDRASQLIQNCSTDREKVATLFAWVQDNIRYVAFEDGIAGFKPDAAQEVLRKKYGDCKGMSNLLKEMLVTQGYDARLAWLGTHHIAYDYSTPSLGIDNHVICALFLDNGIYYLDPTVKYMPLGEYPAAIQGRQTMIENGDDFLLKVIPAFESKLNTDSLFCDYRIENGMLIGEGSYTYKGESKQLLLSLYHATPKDKLNITLKGFLEKGNVQDKVSGIKIEGTDSRAKETKIAFGIANKSSVQQANDEYYIGLDTDKDFSRNVIDTAKRKHDLFFPYKQRIVQNIVLNIPDDHVLVHLPESLSLHRDGYRISLSYTKENSKIVYRKEITFMQQLLNKNNFEQWNRDLAALKKAYREQIVLKKK
jgi:hypothetical protein